MKKLFTLFTALLVVCAASAKEWHITNGTTNIISTTVANASTGDVIYLGDGKYNQPDQISFNGKTLTIQPEDGAKPVIPIHWYCELKDAAKITIKGVKFVGDDNIYVKTAATYYTAEDAEVIAGTKEVGDEKTPAVMMGASDHCFRPYDATAGKVLRLENCEFKGFPDYVILSQRYNTTTAYPLDSLIINDCYFHDNTKSCVIFCNQGTSTAEQLKGLIVKNTTIANNSTTADYSAIYVYNYNGTATSNIEVTVDHCTFYNNPTKDTDHSCIRSYKSTKVSISNCIFAHPTSYGRRATSCYGGTISNCLTYNLTYDSGKDGHRTEGGVPTLTGNFTADPLFTDAANGDFSYAGNWTTGVVSPARGSGTDGSDLGDPRWYSSETLPSTDFASAYVLSEITPQLKGDVSYDSENKEIVYLDKTINGTATWKVHATRACYVTTASFHSGNAYGHQLQIEILDAENNSVGSIQETSTGYSGDINISGGILIPAAGNYTIILSNLTQWSTSQISDLSLTGDPIYTVAGSSAAVFGTIWDEANTDNDMNDIVDSKYTFVKKNVTLTTGTIEFKVVVNHSWSTYYPANNYELSIPADGEYDIWVYFNKGAYEVTAKAIPIVKLAGSFFNPTNDDWAGTARKMTDSEDHISCSITINLNPDRYEFKVIDATTWRGANGDVKRTDCRNWTLLKDGDDGYNKYVNTGIIIDVAGAYTFTYTYENHHLDVTYPMTFSREVTNTDYGTICLPCAAVLSGATAYSVNELHIAEGYVTLTEVGTNLVAGVPYIIKPAAAGTITATMSGDAVSSPVNNNLYGVWGATQIFDASHDVYALYDNKLTHVAGNAQVRVASTKAYFKTTSAAAPSMIRIVDGEEIVTNITDVTDQEQVVKFIENGKFFIRKNGVVYDALGRVVR